MEALLTAYLEDLTGPEGEVLSARFTAGERNGALTVRLQAECREQIGAERLLSAEELARIEERIPKTEEHNP